MTIDDCLTKGLFVMTNGVFRAISMGCALVAMAAPSLAADTAEQRTADALRRIEAIDPKINAVLAIDPTAIEQARRVDQQRLTGALAGQPVLIKDNVEVAGLPTTAGSLALADNLTGRDAPLVARLRRAGAVLIGKTNLSEWANIRSNNSISGWSAVGGQTRNPFALDRNPCGSSSGSGAAVGAGLVNYAIGTETDGSITCPAAINGIVGFKPTVGLVSRTHIVPISASQDTAGPMTRTVRQAAELLNVIAGSDAADPATREADARKIDYAAALDARSLKGKRLGVMRFATGFGTDPAFTAALKLLAAQGATLVEIAKFDDKDIGDNEFAVLMAEFKAGLDSYLATSPAKIPVRSLAEVIAFNSANAGSELTLFGQETFATAQATKGLKDAAYIKARRTSFTAAGPNGIDKLMRDNKVVALIGPTMPPSWKIVAGYPHLTVPMGQVKGLPVGLSFIGAKWLDAMILSLGHAYEQARGPLPGPRFLPSIEESPEIAPLLAKRIRR